MWSGLLVIPPLVVMVISDFRSRRVGIFPLVVTCAMIAASSIAGYGIGGTLLNMIRNGALCILPWFCIRLWLLVRGIKPSDAVGGGDIIFVLALTPLFGMKEFLTFMTVSSVLTLTAWAASRIIIKRDNNSIPLISGLGICLALHLTAQAAGLYRIFNIYSIF